MPKHISLVIACALSCEASALIKAFHLKQFKREHGFSLYCDKAKQILLVVTGVGRLNMATGIGIISQHIMPRTKVCYCNCGIAGAKDIEPGSLLKTSKIIDTTTNLTYYPHILAKETLPLRALHTHDKPQTDYPAKGMVDMEGAAFFHSANLLSPVECILVLKVISDNQDNPSHQISAKKVKNWFNNACSTIVAHIMTLVTHAATLMPCTQNESLFLQIINSLHFSQYQQHELRKRLTQCHYLGLTTKVQQEILQSDKIDNANAFLSKTIDLIDTME